MGINPIEEHMQNGHKKLGRRPESLNEALHVQGIGPLDAEEIFEAIAHHEYDVKPLEDEEQETANRMKKELGVKKSKFPFTSDKSPGEIREYEARRTDQLIRLRVESLKRTYADYFRKQNPPKK